MGGRSHISNSVRAARQPVTTPLERGQDVEFRSPQDFKGWAGGTIRDFENNASGLWVIVKCGRDEFEVPHAWVRPVKRNPRLTPGIETCDAPVGAGSFFRVRARGATHYVRAPKGTRAETVAAAIDRSGWLGTASYALSPVRPRKNPISQSQAANARYAGREVARLVRLREELSEAITEAQHAVGITKKRAQGRVKQLLAEVRTQEQAAASWRRAARTP